MNRRRLNPFLFIIVLMFILQFLSPPLTSAAEKLNYRLKWLFNASVVGDIWATDQGLFSEAGLDVLVKEGGPERDAIKELELGQAQFGVASADQVIRALSKGSPVVVVAQLFQINPLHWIYRSDNMKIDRLDDFKGKIIGITYGGNDETIMRTLLAKSNITESDVKLFSVRYDFTPFFTKKVDIWPCYINSQGPILKQKLADAGEGVAFFNPSDFGVKFVANSVVTSRKMLENNPDTVKKFTTALLSGWRISLDPANRDIVLETLKKYDKNTPPDILALQLDLTRDLIKPDAAVEIGYIDVDAWKQTEEVMIVQKVISSPVSVEKALQPQF
ncbi:MAG: ABC transporter substrate-binding protein [Desulfobacteraceae bacterium]|nr:ABC transporter substrate-binding protein [Desulfobacteraceae bacterium]